MNCSSCTEALPDNAKFCPHCATPVTATQLSEASGHVDAPPAVVGKPQNEAATLDLVKTYAASAAGGALKLGKSVLKSETGQDMAKGAAAGAIIAIPIPLVGPALGAAVGATMVAFHKMTSRK
ncbi:MAG: zinc-ribbon domain-containing protein [Allosphingosinicella sp.]|uniref:zinc-ribbon domain-containing protein n=1 Tax=Allosphingosinicella sp. TaxID=2823234 RepID=UPI00393AD7D4